MNICSSDKQKLGYVKVNMCMTFEERMWSQGNYSHNTADNAAQVITHTQTHAVSLSLNAIKIALKRKVQHTEQ